jgi:8-oxo-dGTP pyrophosphatase MutT (NUDIX family)
MASGLTPEGNLTPVAPARPAATVILARVAGSGYEVLLLRRLASASSFADAFVFPGGVVRQDDFEPDPVPTDFGEAGALSALTSRGSEPPADGALARALFRAAIREVFEEAGVLLARDASDQPLRLNGGNESTRWSAYRDALQSKQLTLRDLLGREALRPDYRSLTYFSHWITPDDIPRRYDTRFFVGPMPDDQTAVHCQVETTESVWIAPRDAIEQAERDLPLVLPTRAHLARLATAPTLSEVLEFARTKAIQTVHARRFSQARVDLVSLSGAGATW